MNASRRLLFACASLCCFACTDGSGDGGTEGADTQTTGTDDGDVVSASDFDVNGPHAVGTVSFETLADPAQADGRQLNVQIWYPATSADGSGLSLAAFEKDTAKRQAIQDLVDAADPACIRDPSQAHEGATPIDGPMPLVVLSHCHDCVRWEASSIAERLASHGIAVIAPDHTDNTIFNRLEGQSGSLSPATLDFRVADIGRVLDVALDPASSELMASGLAGSFDAGAVGMIGHSFGVMTLGRVLQDDDRVKAGMAIAAPLSVFPGTDVAAIQEPVFSLRALEDNSIGALGNDQIGLQFDALGGRAWLADVADAGHWSFFDIAGLDTPFAAGCGMGERQTAPGESFTYLDNGRARDLAAAYAARFFAFTLLDAPIEAGLSEIVDPAVVEIQVR